LLRPIPVVIDSVNSPISKKNLQQLAEVPAANGQRVLLQGTAYLSKQACVLWLAKKWNKEVYRVDLSQVLSKYHNETEKNLDIVFNDAKAKDNILFFDEGDSLFGKRTSVSDSHDRYANQEVSYLISRIEKYEGLLILATNMKSNIDPAFLRRIRYIIKTD
jgi:SpoVK/Ycf46/Vps4 family AAA+-type ATPase